MDVETDRDFHSKVISRDTRAGGLDHVVIHGGNLVRSLPLLSALFTNFSHDDRGARIQCSGL